MVFSRCKGISPVSTVHLVWTVGNGDPMHTVYLAHEEEEEGADTRIIVKE